MRTSKAEASSLLGIVVGVGWLIYAIVRVVRPPPAVAEGVKVMFLASDGNRWLGRVVAMLDSGCVVRTTHGDAHVPLGAIVDTFRG